MLSALVATSNTDVPEVQIVLGCTVISGVAKNFLTFTQSKNEV